MMNNEFIQLSEKCKLFIQDEISEHRLCFISLSSLLEKFLSWHKSNYTTKVESNQELQNMFISCWGPLKHGGWYGIKFNDTEFAANRFVIEHYCTKFVDNPWHF